MEVLTLCTPRTPVYSIHYTQKLVAKDTYIMDLPQNLPTQKGAILFKIKEKYVQAREWLNFLVDN